MNEVQDLRFPFCPWNVDSLVPHGNQITSLVQHFADYRILVTMQLQLSMEIEDKWTMSRRTREWKKYYESESNHFWPFLEIIKVNKRTEEVPSRGWNGYSTWVSRWRKKRQLILLKKLSTSRLEIQTVKLEIFCVATDHKDLGLKRCKMWLQFRWRDQFFDMLLPRAARG